MEAIVAAAIAAIGAFISMGMEGEAQRIRTEIAAQFGPEILPQIDAAVAQEAGSAAPRAESDENRRRQLETLAELDNEYQTGGRSAGDEAAYHQAGRKVSARAGQRAGEIGIDAARRGQTNGPLGAVLASQSSQDELEALASLDSDIASDGRGRAMQALGMKSNLASGVRDDDWKALNAGADATDMMNRFNAAQRQQTTLRNAGIPQQQFDNDMRRRAAQGAARSGVAAGIDGQAAGVRQTAGGLGNAALSYGQAWDWGQKEHDDEEGDH